MKRFFIFCITALTAISVLCGCSAVKNNWIISIDGTKVDKAEYMVYLYEQVKAFEDTGGSDIWAVDFDGVSAQEVAKQNAVNSLLRAKLAVKEASSVGVNGTVDETVVETEGNALYDSIQKDDLGRIPLDDITPELCQSIIRDGLVQGQVFDAVTKSYEVNLQDFEEYFSAYYDENIELYKNMTIKAIYVSADPNAAPPEGTEPAIDEYANKVKQEIDLKGRERIEKAYSLLQEGEEFGLVQFNYSEDPNRREFTMNSELYNEELRSAIYSLKPDEYTDILEYNGAYYIFYAKTVAETPVEEIKPQVQAEYDAAKKEEIYSAQNDSWISAAEIKRNSSVWDSVVITADPAAGTEETDLTEAAITQ